MNIFTNFDLKIWLFGGEDTHMCAKGKDLIPMYVYPCAMKHCALAFSHEARKFWV